MKRQIIKIDKEKCNGCGLCVSACHEGAIGMVNGKAKLLRDDYCDGLGNCLPVCPAGAISFEERETKPFDAEAVKERMKRLINTDEKEAAGVKARGKDLLKTKFADGCLGEASKTIDAPEEPKLPCGCPGSNSKTLESNNNNTKEPEEHNNQGDSIASQLRQWPVQIKLVPVRAPYFENADLLIAADCSAFACGDFHDKYMKGKVTVVGCPKLDNADYTQKLSEIIKNNNIKSVTAVKMEVPCCTGIANAALEAVKLSGKEIKVNVVTLSLNGKEI